MDGREVALTRRPLRIGIDGRWFFRGNPSSRVIVRNLLRQVLECHPEHDYFVFLPRRDRRLPFPHAHGRIHLLYLPNVNGFLSNCLLLPWRARGLRLDVCLSFYFPPLYGNYKKFVWINDSIFREYPEYFTWKEKAYFRPMRLLSRRADRICTLSRHEKERLARFGYAAAEKIVPVPLGVDEAFKPVFGHDPDKLREIRERYRLPERFLLYVGRMNARKNILNLLLAVQLLRDRDVVLVLAGDRDWKMFDLPTKISQLGLAQRVLLTGPVPDEDLPSMYALARVFCYVSFAEGFGLPPLESMASGVPVVVSDRDSLPEVCGEAGSYADPESPREIARAIDSLLTDPGLWREKSAQGLERARSFTWSRSAETLISAFRELLL